jgi:hypothetical protein
MMILKKNHSVLFSKLIFFLIFFQNLLCQNLTYSWSQDSQYTAKNKPSKPCALFWNAQIVTKSDNPFASENHFVLYYSQEESNGVHFFGEESNNAYYLEDSLLLKNHNKIENKFKDKLKALNQSNFQFLTEPNFDDGPVADHCDDIDKNSEHENSEHRSIIIETDNISFSDTLMEAPFGFEIKPKTKSFDLIKSFVFHSTDQFFVIDGTISFDPFLIHLWFWNANCNITFNPLLYTCYN